MLNLLNEYFKVLAKLCGYLLATRNNKLINNININNDNINNINNIIGYCDFDQAWDLDSRRSIIEYIFYYINNLISWNLTL